MSELSLKNIYGHSKYAGHSLDQVEKLILQTEAELTREHRLNQLNFMSYVGIITMVVVLLLLSCFCKKCNLWKMWMNDDWC